MAARKPPRRSLLDLCDAAGISAAELAADLGVSREAVYRWNARQKRPRDDRIAPLAARLGVSREAAEAVLAPHRRPGAPRKH